MNTCITDHPVAYESYDHIYPVGTMRDNSRNHIFNERLYALFDHKISVLDMGCAGGGFISDCVADGHFGIGVEGSDLSFKAQRAEWPIIPNNLFLADITYPFRIERDGEIVKFDVITAWEVLEHIERGSLHSVWENMLANSKPGGLFVCSIPEFSWLEQGVDLHRTVDKCEWWSAQIESIGYRRQPAMEKHFGDQWIRATSCQYVFKLA